ncbi:MAG TPA: hypothetical protein P5277_03715 [Candidatus Paceibacterota bacterium]|nr:hypothetical protein [Candidatus Paceibacterota bacterium]
MVSSIGVILQQWADMDIFYYVIPFLLIFALVFAILQKVKIMGGDEEDNRRISAVIAISVALLSLQFDQVSIFFAILFPKLGVGLAVLLTVIIILGVFIDYRKSQGAYYIFLIIGGVVGAVILLSTLSDYSWYTGSFFQDNMSAIVAGIILIIFVGAVITSGKKDRGQPSLFFSPVPPKTTS